jgi:hydroxymethylglutaryl-CoA lyase
LIDASRAAQEVLGRSLGSHVLLAGPVEWESS